MKCDKIKKLISGLLDQGISEALQQEIFEHIKKCPDCRSEYEELNSLDRIINTQSVKEPPKEYWDNYWMRLEKRFAEKSFKPRYSVFRRIKEIYFPFFPLPELRPVFGTVIIALLVLVSILSFKVGRKTENIYIMASKGIYDQGRISTVLTGYERMGYPESAAKALIAQHLIKNFFKDLSLLYRKEGLDEFVTYIDKGGKEAGRFESAASRMALLEGAESGRKDYDTTITIPDVMVGEKNVVIKAAAKHTL